MSSNSPTPVPTTAPRETKKRAKRRFEIKVVHPGGNIVRFFGDDTTMTPEALDAMTPLCDAILALLTAHVAKEKK